MNSRRVYLLISTILLAFSFSILVGEFSLVRAQASELGSFEESEEQNLQPTETDIESVEQWREQQEQKLEQELAESRAQVTELLERAACSPQPSEFKECTEAVDEVATEELVPGQNPANQR